MIVSYVILHYLAIQDTIECTKSIDEQLIPFTKHEVNIVIVDNGSPNHSYSELEKTFHLNPHIHLIKSEQNLGFAKGNNLGFQYAKYQLQSDFIVLLNNDTIIRQHDFTEVLVNKYYKKKYGVLGPDIIAADGYHQNPGNRQSWSIGELRLFRIKKRIQILLSYLRMDAVSAKNVDNEIYRAETFQGDMEGTILHGACLIFSPDYIKRFEGLHDETFLYMEEDILKLYADYYGFLMLYSSDLQIYHKEDAATNMVEISDREKVRRKYRLLIDSSKIYSRLKKRMIRKKTMIHSMRRMAQMIKSTGKEYQIDLNIPLSYLVGMSLKRIMMFIRGKIKTFGMKKAGKIIFCGKNVKLICRSKMRIGTGVTIQDNVYMDALSKAGITIEDGCSIGAGTTIRCSGNLKEIGAGFYLGKDSSLADHCFVGATGGVYIGDHVIGGQNIRFHSSNHRFSDSHRWIKDQGITAEGIRIGNNCWIGAGAVFCDGVTIGDGCVIAANAVVTKNFSANSVIAGVPAKTIAKRSRTR